MHETDYKAYISILLECIANFQIRDSTFALQ